MPDKTPYVLMILDGWGYRENSASNAIALANTPVWDRLWQQCPHCLISSSGLDVGLPTGQMGNSEVGHMNLGAGRVLAQDLTRITQAIADGSFFTNPLLQSVFTQLAHQDKTLHLLGLLSPGGVHSHQEHIKAAVAMAFKFGVPRVYLHAFLDGRDVPPNSARSMLDAMQQHILALGQGGIASIIGRYYAMDRDQRWERIAPAYHLINQGEADFVYANPLTALDAAYMREESDEFVQASAIYQEGAKVTLHDGDGIVFMNFRADRARQLTHAFVDRIFSGFNRQPTPKLSSFVTLTEYAVDISCPCVFTPEPLNNSLGEYIASLQKTQLRIAETEKYAHVTFFFSGGREQPYPGESRILIPSPKVATYDLQPQMSAPEVTNKLIAAIYSREFDLIVCNFANADMVGHTGNLKAAISAVECLDACLGKVETALISVIGHGVITADHGNVEYMVDEMTGQRHTAHTSGRVPLIYIGEHTLQLKPEGGTLSDIAPTLLAIMGLPKPPEMSDSSLIQEH